MICNSDPRNDALAATQRSLSFKDDISSVSGSADVAQLLRLHSFAERHDGCG